MSFLPDLPFHIAPDMPRRTFYCLSNPTQEPMEGQGYHPELRLGEYVQRPKCLRKLNWNFYTWL